MPLQPLAFKLLDSTKPTTEMLPPSRCLTLKTPPWAIMFVAGRKESAQTSTGLLPSYYRIGHRNTVFLRGSTCR